jgi:hypothetical protein
MIFCLQREISAGRITIKQARSLKNLEKNDIVSDMIFLLSRQMILPLFWKKVINDRK